MLNSNCCLLLFLNFVFYCDVEKSFEKEKRSSLVLELIIILIFSFLRPGWLLITANWLCYQAPEIMRALDPLQPGSEVHLYTKETDIYAFG